MVVEVVAEVLRLNKSPMDSFVVPGRGRGRVRGRGRGRGRGDAAHNNSELIDDPSWNGDNGEEMEISTEDAPAEDQFHQYET